MKKLLSILCVVTLLATSMTVLSVSASADFPLTIGFTEGGFTTITNANWGLTADAETTYDHPLDIPNGWNWKATYDFPAYNHASLTDTTYKRATVQTKSDGVTYLGMAGTDLSITKMIDITPGYTYTISTTAYATNNTTSNQRASLAYWLYHKDDNGNYIEINDYLSNSNANTLSVTSEHKSANAWSGENQFTQTTWLGSIAYVTTLSFEVPVSDSSVNAIMVGLGGYSECNANASNAVWHNGVQVEKSAESVPINPNPTHWHKAQFTEGASTTITNAKWGTEENAETTYDHTVVIPTGWNYRPTYSTSAAQGQYGNTEARFQRSQLLTKEGRTYLGISGSDVALTKMVDIDPGYTYTLSTNAYASVTAANGDYRSSLAYWFYHKDENGNYVEINDYLSQVNGKSLSATTTTENEKKNAWNFGTDYVATKWAGTDAAVANISLTFTIVDSAVNAIMVGLDGYDDSTLNTSYMSYYDGFTIDRVPAGSVIDTQRDVTVNYDSIPTVVSVNTGSAEVSLRPATAEDGTTKIVSASGYFKGWQLGETDIVYTSEKGKKAPIGEYDTTLSFNSLWYTIENNVISSAQAQMVTLSSGSNAIRFLALIDATYENYAKAGFVVTTLAQNPTVEAGYKPYTFNNIFAKIRSGNSVLDITDSTLLSKFTKGASMNPTGILYANLVIPEGSEKITYYATPYVEATDGTRVYGSTKAISYTQLETLDVQ